MNEENCKQTNKQTNSGDNNKKKVTAIQRRNVPVLWQWQVSEHLLSDKFTLTKKSSFEEEGRNKHTQTEW